jgi:glycosyltransferase involved in cell wall biosynthesis
MNPLVSILIPAFNAQEWLADTIKSALGQTWPRTEVIVVDDGSVDETLRIAKRFASDKLLVLKQSNQGAAAARNKAFELCQGDYIQWLDADDILAPDKIAKQLRALDDCSNRRSLCSSAWGQFIYCLDRAHFVPTPLWCDLAPVEWILRKMAHGVYMQTTSWLVSRELTEAAGPWDTRLSADDDGEYFCRVVKASDVIRFVEDAKVFYRRDSSNSLSYIGRSDKKLAAQFLSIQLCIDHLLSLEDSERSRAASLKFLQSHMIYYYPERNAIVIEAEKLAATLGGQLQLPRLSWKYAWIKPLFGWVPAKRAQLMLPKVKRSFVRSWDWAMSKRCRRNSMISGF